MKTKEQLLPLTDSIEVNVLLIFEEKMELNELAKTANAALSLSEGLEGKELKKAVIDLVLAIAEEAVKLRRLSLNCAIETKRLKGKYDRLKSKLEDFKEYDKEDRT